MIPGVYQKGWLINRNLAFARTPRFTGVLPKGRETKLILCHYEVRLLFCLMGRRLTPHLYPYTVE